MEQTDRTYSETTMKTIPEAPPELRQILDSLLNVTERLESRGAELWAFEPKVSLNGVASSVLQPTTKPEEIENYVTQLRNILGRLRAVEEGEGASIGVLRAFL